MLVCLAAFTSLARGARRKHEIARRGLDASLISRAFTIWANCPVRCPRPRPRPAVLLPRPVPLPTHEPFSHLVDISVTSANPSLTHPRSRCLSCELRVPESDRILISNSKRDGRKERVQFDKITSRVARLCYNLDAEHVFAEAITQKVPSSSRSHTLKHECMRIFVHVC